MCVPVLSDKRSTTEGAIFGSFGVCTLWFFLFFQCLHFGAIVLFFSIFSGSFLKNLLVLSFSFRYFFFFLMVFSAALNRRPYDCMHSAGEDGGLERVFINHHTNTNCVAEKRSTAANHVSNYMAQFYCLLHVIYYPR